MKSRQGDSALRFFVQSEYDSDVEYLVDLAEGDGGVCSCWRSWNFHERCKHIAVVREQFCDEMIERCKKLDLNEPALEPLAHANKLMEVKEDKGGKEESRETIGTNRNHKKQISANADLVMIPLALDSPNFRIVLQHFVDHRKNLKKPITQRGLELIVKDCITMGAVDAVESIETSIRNGWMGIFPRHTEALPDSDRKILEMDPLTMDEETRHRWTMLDYARRH